MPPGSTPRSQHSAALRSLVLQLVAARRRDRADLRRHDRRSAAASSRPLHNMRDAMLKVAAGDLTVDTGYAERRDEIGALAGALETFKQQAVDKLRIEQQERERNAGAAARQTGDRGLCRRVREPWCARPCSSWATPPTRCGPPPRACRRFRARPTQRVQVAEKASGEASMSVESVASASRGVERLDQRHQPAGRACRRDRQPRRRSGAGDRRHGAGAGEDRPAGSAKWSA